MLDGTRPLTEEDEQIIDLIKNKNVIVLLNKIDKDCIIDKEDIRKKFSGEYALLEISAKESIGIDSLEKVIEEMFMEGTISSKDEMYITNIRQAEALLSAKNSYELVLNSINDGLPEDFYSIDLMNAYSSLGRIIGEDVDDDLVNEIFTKFCMGK